MPEVSNSRKFVAASRVAGRYAGRSRTLSAARSAISTVAHSLWKAFHRLWHEVMGFVFFIFALIGALAAYREYRKYALEAPHPGASHWLVAAAFALMFLYFSISSFWRARAGVKFKGKK